MSYIEQTFANLALGLNTALSLDNLFYCVVGVVLGQVLGVLPGIGTLLAITLLLPITFYLDPTASIIMVAGIFYGSTYGGSIASILINMPGTAASAVACLDGYPMARQGRAGIALSMTTVASFFGAGVGIILMILFAPVIARNALYFGPWEYFSLMLFGLVMASTLGSGSVLKGVASVIAGITLGLVGIDIHSGEPRFTFSAIGLLDGITLVAVAMGVFGVAEVVWSQRDLLKRRATRFEVTFRSMIPTRDDVQRSWMPMARGAAIGSFFGTLPGTGPFIASFASYGVERSIAKEPDRFGKGAIEGIMGPETANNAADQTAFIPTMSLGIPGSPTMAIVLGILIMNGITPGPSLVNDRPELFWGLIMSFWIGNILLVIMNIPLIWLWIKLLTIPYHLLFPAILALVFIGTHSVDRSGFGIMIVVFLGAVGYTFKVLDIPLAPLILGFVLGPMMESHLRRALSFSRGDFSVFLDRRISLVLLIMTALAILWPALRFVYRRLSGRAAR